MIDEEADKALLSRNGYNSDLNLIKTKWDCLNYGGEWVNPDLNFDTTM